MCVCVLALSVLLRGHLVPFKYVITSCVHSVNMLTALAVGRKDVCVNHSNAHSYGTLDYKSVCVLSVWCLCYWRFQDAHIKPPLAPSIILMNNECRAAKMFLD